MQCNTERTTSGPGTQHRPPPPPPHSHPSTNLLLAGMEYLARARERGRGLAPPGTPPAPATPVHSRSRSQRGCRRRGPPTRTCRCSRERRRRPPGRSAHWGHSRWGNPAWPAGGVAGAVRRASSALLQLPCTTEKCSAQHSSVQYSTARPSSPPLPPAGRRRRN